MSSQSGEHTGANPLNWATVHNQEAGVRTLRYTYSDFLHDRVLQILWFDHRVELLVLFFHSLLHFEVHVGLFDVPGQHVVDCLRHVLLHRYQLTHVLRVVLRQNLVFPAVKIKNGTNENGVVDVLTLREW